MTDLDGGSSGLAPRRLEYDYASWAVDFQAFLETKDLWGTIEDPLPPNPQAAGEYADWSKLDRKALAWIRRGVEAVHHDKVDGCNTAKQAWDALKNAFEASVTARGLQLQRGMTNLRKQPEETIMQYAGRAGSLRSALRRADNEITEKAELGFLLDGIREEAYQPTIAVLINQSRLPSWEDAIGALLPVESRLKERAHESNKTSGGPNALASISDNADGGAGGRMSKAERRCEWCVTPATRRATTPASVTSGEAVGGKGVAGKMAEQPPTTCRSASVPKPSFPSSHQLTRRRRGRRRARLWQQLSRLTRTPGYWTLAHPTTWQRAATRYKTT